MKRITGILCIMFLAAGMIFANGAKESASGKDVTLTVLWFNDANESDVFKSTIQDYLTANPNVKLDLQVVAFNDYEQKLKLMISGGNPPDLARLTTAQIVTFMDTLEPLDSYTNIAQVKKDFMPAMLAYGINSKGQVCAYPTEATANGMIVNKTAWNKAGIDVKTLSKTWTWDQWEEAAKKVLKANDKVKYGLAVDFTPHRFSTIMYEMGGRFLSADQKKVELNNPGTINAINMFKKYHDEGLIPQSVWLGSENPAEMFQAGIVACHIGGSWNINQYAKNVKDFEWCVVSTPKGTINSSVPGGKFIAAFKDGKNKAAAMKLMAAFSDKAHNEKYCLGTSNLSSRQDAAIKYPANSDDFAVFQKDLAATPAFTAGEWRDPRVAKLSATIKEQIVQVLMGKESAEDAVKNVDAKGAAF